MGRAIGSVLVAIAVVSLLNIVLLSIVEMALAPQHIIDPVSKDVTILYLAIKTATTVVAAFCAGHVCRRIAKGQVPVRVFAMLYLAGAMMMAFASVSYHKALSTPAKHFTPIEALMLLKQSWYILLMPLWCYFSILIGGGFKKEPPLTTPKVA